MPWLAYGSALATTRALRSKRNRTSHARRHAFALVDLPGTYSLAPRSPDEMVAVDVLLGRQRMPCPDVVLCIVDASNLQRICTS